MQDARALTRRPYTLTTNIRQSPTPETTLPTAVEVREDGRYLISLPCFAHGVFDRADKTQDPHFIGSTVRRGTTD